MIFKRNLGRKRILDSKQIEECIGICVSCIKNFFSQNRYLFGSVKYLSNNIQIP